MDFGVYSANVSLGSALSKQPWNLVGNDNLSDQALGLTHGAWSVVLCLTRPVQQTLCYEFLIM